MKKNQYHLCLLLCNRVCRQTERTRNFFGKRKIFENQRAVRIHGSIRQQ